MAPILQQVSHPIGTHRRLGRLLEAYVNGELDPHRASRLVQHVADEPAVPIHGGRDPRAQAGLAAATLLIRPRVG